jgi:release factor glutamine methyltransferase
LSENTLIEILRKGESFLAQKSTPSPRLEAQVIFAHLLGLRRIDLFLQPDRPLTALELTSLRAALVQKAAGMPTAYILKSKEFFGRPFIVSPAVLIPRPETEELAELVVKEAAGARDIIDLGAGSGCLGITLALELKSSSLTLIDISVEALAIASQNAAALTDSTAMHVSTVNADFTKGDFSPKAAVDLIVSNPPYVLPEEFSGLDPSVRDHEPRLALVPENFEALHQGLIATALRDLRQGGLLAIETHPQRSTDVADWARGHGFVRVEVRNDLSSRPHFVFAWK